MLAAQTYAWGNDFDNARNELRQINIEETGYRDGILTWIDVEKWDERYAEALRYCHLGQRFYPNDNAFLLREAEVLELTGKVFEAKRVIYQELLTDPNNLQLINAYNHLRSMSSDQLIEHLSLKDSKQDLALIDADNLLLQARDLAGQGDFITARRIVQQILEADPDHVEARLLMGNTYAWNQEFDQARAWLEDLKYDAFDNYDLIVALANLEAWDQNFGEALNHIAYGLEIYPNDLDLSLKKSQIQQNMGDIGQSNATIGDLLQQDPNNPELRRAYYSQKGPQAITGISGEYSHNRYNVPLVRRWNMYSLKYYKTVDLGTFIGSINTGYVSTGNTPFMSGGGVQFQVDAYPVFPMSKRYFHFSYAISPSPVFARHRLGAHIYQELRNSWEVFGGFNYAHYKNATDTLNVLMFDAGVTKYFGNNMLTLAAQFAPNNTTGVTKLAQGYSATLRHYLKTAHDWVQVSVGSGVSPDNPLWYINDPSWNPGQMLNAYSVVLAYRKLLNDRWIGRVYGGYIYEEYLQSRFRNVYTFNIGLIYLFD